MKVTVLGTGSSQGIPVVACNCKVCKSNDSKDKRLRTSIMITIDGKNIVIDSGPDFRHQMLRENVDKIDAIVFTHQHKDHTGGLDEIRAFNWVNKQAVDIYAEERVLNSLESSFEYVFSKIKYPGAPEINIHTIDEIPFNIGNTHIVPIRGMHMKLPVLGYRINNFAYLTDFNFIEKNQLKKLEGIEVLILNSLRHETHISHYSLSESLDLIKKINPQKAYLTHISHQMGLYSEINPTLPQNVELAYDRLVLNI